jgi:hypothetical protein
MEKVNLAEKLSKFSDTGNINNEMTLKEHEKFLG